MTVTSGAARVRAGQPSAARAVADGAARKVLFLLPGAGAEERGMGLALAAEFPPAAALLARATRETGADLAAILRDGGAALARPEVAEPALVAVALGAVRAARRAGLVPHLVAGAGAGELAAWAASGAIPGEEAVALARRRSAPGGAGAFLAALREVRPCVPAAALVSSVTGAPARGGEIPGLLERGRTEPARLEAVLACAVRLGATDVVLPGAARALAGVVWRGAGRSVRVHPVTDLASAVRAAAAVRAGLGPAA